MYEPSYSSLLYLPNNVFAFAFFKEISVTYLVGPEILSILRKQLLWKTSTFFMSLSIIHQHSDP